MEELWQALAGSLRDSLGQVSYETWIKPLNFAGIRGRTVTLEAPNRFFVDWVSERYLESIRRSISAHTGENIEVKMVVQNGVDHAPPDTGHPHGSRKRNSQNTASEMPLAQAERHPQLNPRYTFEEFVVGSANQFAHAAALAVAKQPGEKYNPLFIYGGVGLGKTHLASAIGHYMWTRANRHMRIIYLPAEVFMNELISSLKRDRMTEFKDKFRRADALILDDVQFLAGRERTQEEFFHTFNSLHGDRHQIVLTSDKIPREIPELEERLRNRFESGLIADIMPPDLETRVAIIQRKADLEHLKLTPEVTLYIAQSVSSNVRELEGCLTRLAALASINSSEITVEFARQALHDLVGGEQKRPDIEVVQKAVSEFFHVRLADLKSKKRTQHVAFCRQVAMYLCRKVTASSFPAIGEAFGRDHSTVIHAYNAIDRRARNDAAFRISLEKIARSYRNGTGH
jgi:chromosomal replication initiator protein